MGAADYRCVLWLGRTNVSVSKKQSPLAGGHSKLSEGGAMAKSKQTIKTTHLKNLENYLREERAIWQSLKKKTSSVCMQEKCDTAIWVLNRTLQQIRKDGL